MVPSPHLFEEIAVGYQGERLELGVRYRGQKREAGDPRFFLSNAQGNVLAIAIFLSLAAKRTWCRMDTLLMDDPVQHLDDLDAVALLDAIREAAMGRFGTRKQVVVSTCDRNLYLLMLRKFRALQDHGLSCTGISLVDRGRLGPEVVYDTGGPERVSASA
jgi:ABC-type cobalamin/Fe3+-siderophores transport system ATPase subunit